MTQTTDDGGTAGMTQTTDDGGISVICQTKEAWKFNIFLFRKRRDF